MQLEEYELRPSFNAYFCFSDSSNPHKVFEDISSPLNTRFDLQFEYVSRQFRCMVK